MTLTVEAIGMVSSVGNDACSSCAAQRAGIGRFESIGAELGLDDDELDFELEWVGVDGSASGAGLSPSNTALWPVAIADGAGRILVSMTRNSPKATGAGYGSERERPELSVASSMSSQTLNHWSSKWGVNP